MNNQTYLPGEVPPQQTTCHGCKNLTYTQPSDPFEATGGGTYRCLKFAQKMQACETPIPITPTCKDES